MTVRTPAELEELIQFVEFMQSPEGKRLAEALVRRGIVELPNLETALLSCSVEPAVG